MLNGLVKISPTKTVSHWANLPMMGKDLKSTHAVFFSSMNKGAMIRNTDKCLGMKERDRESPLSDCLLFFSRLLTGKGLIVVVCNPPTTQLYPDGQKRVKAYRFWAVEGGGTHIRIASSGSFCPVEKLFSGGGNHIFPVRESDRGRIYPRQGVFIG